MAAITVGGGGGNGFPAEDEAISVKQEPTVLDSAAPFVGLSDSSSSAVETVKVDDAVSRVNEEEVGDVGAVNAVNFNGGESSSEMGLPKPMEGLDKMGPPPFLKKTFEMVDDPESDPIVSWSSTRNSFIVWDSHNFSLNLLPKYFKHRNFSSFIRQLNTYGFRKVDSDRWEFANEAFQEGKKHLLKNIKRRSRSNGNKQRQSIHTSTIPSPLCLETEIGSLKEDQSSLRSEILKLKLQQEESDHTMVTMQERLRGAESKQQRILGFFAKAAIDQGFVQRLMKKRKQRQELEVGEFMKKLKLLHNQEIKENLCNDDIERDLIHEEMTPFDNACFSLSAGDEFESCIRGSVTDQSDNVMSDEFLEDGLVTGKEKSGDDITPSDSKIYTELEDLIGKARGWSGRGRVGATPSI